MSTATLVINGDTSGLVAAFSDAAKAAAAAEKSIAKSAQDGARKASDSYRNSQRAFVSAQRSMVVEAQRAVAAEVKAEQQRARAARMSADARKKAETEATRVAREEAQKRGLSAEQEARVKQNALEKYTRLYESEERKQTVAAEREAAKRRQAMQQTFNAWRNHRIQEGREGMQNVGRVASAAGGAVSGAAGIAGTAIGMIRDARQSRAQGDRTLSQAVRNAGGSEADVTAARARVRQFSQQTGIEFGDVAGALEMGQERGSSLEAAPGETMAQSMERALELVREANAENASPGQYLAARGRLQASGLRGDALKTAMRFSLAAAQSGQVEVDQLLDQGLPGATRLMESRVNALGPNATDAQKQEARINAYRESVSTQEVLAASGGRSRQTSNALASLQNFMNTPRRQEAALVNIQSAERTVNTATPEGRERAARLHALYSGDNAIFERDPTRTGNAMRLRAGVSPTELASRVAGASGGDAQAGANIFAGGGHGNPQAFLSNMRDLMAVLGGERGQRIQTMMQSRGVTDEQVARHEAAVEGDDLSNFNRLEETRLNALTTNTAGLTRLTDSIDRFNAANPITAVAAPTVAAGIAATLGAKVTAGAAGVGVVGAGLYANTRAAVTGEDVSGRKLGMMERAGRAAMMPLALLGPVGGMIAGAPGVRDLGRAAGTEQGMSALLSLPQRIVDAIQGATITATVSPTDAAQAASTAPVPSPPAR
jgi:hypothetical protein